MLRPPPRVAPNRFRVSFTRLTTVFWFVRFFLSHQVLASQLMLVDEVMKAGKQMGQAPPGGPGGMMEE